MKEIKKQIAMLMLMDLVECELLSEEEAELANRLFLRNEEKFITENATDDGEAA